MENNTNSNQVEPEESSAPSARQKRGMSSSRRKVLNLLRSQNNPITISTLCELTHLHENTLREHLDALLDTGLITRHRAPAQGRGRPNWLWQATTSGQSEYAQLATALADAIQNSATNPSAVAEKSGRRWGKELALNTHGDGPKSPVKIIGSNQNNSGLKNQGNPAKQLAYARKSIVEILRNLGFSPRLDLKQRTIDGGSTSPTNTPANLTDNPTVSSLNSASAPTTAELSTPSTPLTPTKPSTPNKPQPIADSSSLLLATCPLLSAADKFPEVICSLHLGIVKGAATALGVSAENSTLIKRPGHQECLLQLRLSKTS